MDISSTASHTLNQALKQLDQAAAGVRRATNDPVKRSSASSQATNSPQDADTVDLSTEALNLLAAKRAFEAGIALAKTADEIDEQTIDLLG